MGKRGKPPSVNSKNLTSAVCPIYMCLFLSISSLASCGNFIPHEAREEILRNKHMYIGQTAEVRFFEFTDGGLPRFPICYGFRFDK